MTLTEHAKNAAHRASAPLRDGYYRRGRGARVVPRLPGGVRKKLGLDDQSAVGSRKIEIGGGPFPQPGYIHVDIDTRARHLEAFAPAWDLPFPDGWAEEIVAVHSLEHVYPPMLVPTLKEWRRVLAPGGRVRVHVPNTEELFTSFLASPVEEKWRTMGAMLGMYCHPGVLTPEGLEVPSDHQLMFDWDMLRWALAEGGFEQISDLTGQVSDGHTDGWREVVPHFSIIAEATKPG